MVIIVKPVYDQDLIYKQVIKEIQREANFKRIQDPRKIKQAIIQVDLLNDPELDITLSELQNEMAEELAQQEEPLQIVFFGDKNPNTKENGKHIGRSSQDLRNTENRHSQ